MAAPPEWFPEGLYNQGCFSFFIDMDVELYFFAGLAVLSGCFVLGRVFPCVPRQILPRFER
jgi:hypothetical protein